MRSVNMCLVPLEGLPDMHWERLLQLCLEIIAILKSLVYQSSVKVGIQRSIQILRSILTARTMLLCAAWLLAFKARQDQTKRTPTGCTILNTSFRSWAGPTRNRMHHLEVFERA